MPARSYTLFPMAVVSRGMNNSIYNHGVANYPEDNTVGKPVRVGPAHLFAAGTNLVNKRIGGQTFNRFTSGPKKLAAEPSLCCSYHASASIRSASTSGRTTSR